MIRKAFIVSSLIILIALTTGLILCSYSKDRGNNTSIQAGWDARAELAKERLKTMNANPADLKSKYEYLVERAFACHTDPELIKKLRIQQGNSSVYKISLQCGPVMGKDCMVVNYVYDNTTKALVSAYVENIPRNWTMMCYQGKTHRLILSDGSGNRFIFDSGDPLNVRVAMAKK